MNQVQQDLEAAVAVLEAKGWCQGRYQEEDGRVCSKGAVAEAIGIAGWQRVSHADILSLNQREMAALMALAKGLPAPYDPSTPHDQFEMCRIAAFNDLDSTSVEDVKLMFKRAIEIAEEADK